MMIRNLTPHDVVILTPDGEPITTLPPDGTTVRLELDTAPDGKVAGIPVVRTTPRHLVGLPDPAPDTHLVVGSVIAHAARDTGRTTADLLVPHGQVRNAAGQPIGCTALARVTSVG